MAARGVTPALRCWCLAMKEMTSCYGNDSGARSDIMFSQSALMELRQSRDNNDRGAAATGYGCVVGSRRMNRRRTEPVTLDMCRCGVGCLR